MATYIGSPWGIIKGKVGPAIGQTWRGVKTVRMKKNPIVRGSKEWQNKLENGEIELSQFSIPQSNTIILRAILGHIVHIALSPIIHPAWEKLVPKNTPMSSSNLFFKHNFTPLYHSINKNEFISNTNFPSFLKLSLTFGILENTPIKNVSFQNNIIKVSWDNKCFTNGSSNDDVYLFAITCDLPKKPTYTYIKNISTQIKLYGDARFALAKRKDQSAQLSISVSGEPVPKSQFLIIYLSFSNPALGFSDSPAFTLSTS